MQNIKPKINFFNQNFNKNILKNLSKKLKNDLWINGKFVNILEKNLEKFLKTSKKVSTCNSGSDALLLALLLDRHPKKNIYLTTPFSYIASSSIAKFLKLEVIYIDVSEDNYLLDIDKLEFFLKKCPLKIREKIRGVINVEIFGSTNNLIKLNKIAKKYKLSLIGDCAQSFGTKYKKKSSITYYDYSTLSFYPTKIYSCYGDGGAIVINKNKLHKSILLKNNGHEFQNKDNCKVLGINSRLDNIQAYILNENLKKINLTIKKRHNNFNILKKSNPSFLKLPVFDKNVDSNNYIYSVYINNKMRNQFIMHMKNNKIQCVVYYKKLLSQNLILKPIIKNKLTNAIHCSKSLVCIPSHENITKKEILKVSKIISNFKFK